MELIDEAELYDILNEEVEPPTTDATTPATGSKAGKRKKKKENNEDEPESQEQQEAQPQEIPQQEPQEQEPAAGNIMSSPAVRGLQSTLTYAMYPTMIAGTQRAIGGIGSAVSAGATGAYNLARQNPALLAVATGALALTGGLIFLLRKYHGTSAEQRISRMKMKCETITDPLSKIRCQQQLTNYIIQVSNSTMLKSHDPKEKERLLKEREKYKKILVTLTQRESKLKGRV